MVLIIGAYKFGHYVQNFVQHRAVKVTSYAEEITGDNQWDFDATCSY